MDYGSTTSSDITRNGAWQSAFGFSMIYVVFEDNVDLYFAQLVFSNA